MSGIYIHIPFCKQACVYCDFHFSTLLGNREIMVEAIIAEAKQRCEYLDFPIIDSLYFGGGTPSILGVDKIKWLIDELANIFAIDRETEITLEANPDDLSADYLAALKIVR